MTLRIEAGGYSARSKREFTAYQQKRRRELWSLLGDLPTDHKPRLIRTRKKEKHEGYTLEHLLLDLNGIEPVPALLLLPEKRAEKAPGLLYIHAHGGTYGLGKEELVKGRDVLPAYAPVCARMARVMPLKMRSTKTAKTCVSVTINSVTDP